MHSCIRLLNEPLWNARLLFGKFFLRALPLREIVGNKGESQVDLMKPTV